jgi:putative phage-type endonuclease
VHNFIFTSRDSWLNWRKQGLGSSDAPIIMGVSPWKTPHQLWLEKTGKTAGEPTNTYILEKGHNMEPKARALYEIMDKTSYTPVNIQREDHPHLKASLDGYNAEKNIALEIKYAGKEDHENAAAGIVPEKYYWQLQHQLMVSDAQMVKYISFDGSTINLIEVLPNNRDIKKLFKALNDFWTLVVTNEEPELSDKDCAKVNDQDLLCDLLSWQIAKDNLKRQEEIVAALQEKILTNELVKDRSISCGYFTVKTVVRKGNVNYKNIPQLKDIDLEPFRGKPSKYQQIRKVEK